MSIDDTYRVSKQYIDDTFCIDFWQRYTSQVKMHQIMSKSYIQILVTYIRAIQSLVELQ